MVVGREQGRKRAEKKQAAHAKPLSRVAGAVNNAGLTIVNLSGAFDAP